MEGSPSSPAYGRFASSRHGDGTFKVELRNPAFKVELNRGGPRQSRPGGPRQSRPGGPRQRPSRRLWGRWARIPGRPPSSEPLKKGDF